MVRSFIARLLSRKFLMALGGALTFYAQKDYHSMMLVIMAYIGVEGGADVVGRYSEERTKQFRVLQGAEPDDKKVIVPGNSVTTPVASDDNPMVIIPGEQ